MSANTDLHTVAFVAPPPHNKPVTASPSTILLVEDDRALRRYFQVILERAGYAVVAAPDGLEAMKASLTQTFHAVITDAIMPNLGGKELCRFLRRHPELKTLPIILLSGSDQLTLPDEADELADAYLSKPVRAEVLIDCVRNLLAKES